MLSKHVMEDNMNLGKHARGLRFAAPAGLIALLVMTLALGPVFAVGVTGSDFDSGDGNLKVDPPPALDWGNVTEFRQDDKPSGSSDDSFSQGAKEDTLVPAIESGSIPPNKSDLKTFGVYAEKTAAGRNFLHLFWTRVQDPSGTTNMDFEFNQQSTLTSNGITPVRTTGDLLITYDLSRGGTVPTISVRFWGGSAWGPAQDLSSQGKATGSINTVAIPASESDGLGSLSPRTFGEATVDLDAIFPADQCNPLGFAFLKSRSSDSFTAAMKDFIAPIAVNISNCGTIVIKKVTDPSPDPADPDTSFTYNTTGGLSPATFTLSNGQTRTFNGVGAGNYTVTETVDDRYELHELTCTASGAGTSAATSVANATASITLAAGGLVECTFTNDYKDHIRVDKVTFPANDPQEFQFSLTGPGGVNRSFSLTDRQAAYDSGPLNSGTGYAVSETVPPGWAQTAASCTDGVSTFSPTSLTMGTGRAILCTFENTKLGRIIIRKQTNPTGSPQTFTFAASYAANGFTLAHGQEHNSGLLMPGTYQVSETLPAGWAQSSATCSDGSTLPNIVLDPGETVTCTFNNTQKFVTIVLVCEQGPGTLYPSSVNAATSLTQAQLKGAGFTDAQIKTLCDLNLGARFSNLNPGGPTNYAVTIPTQYPLP